MACSGGVTDNKGEQERDAGAAGSAGEPALPEEGNWPEVKSWFGELSTIAGAGKSDSLNEWKPSFEGGPAVSAELSRPHIALADEEGNIYIADKEAHAVRRVTTDGIIHTFAGTNQPGDAPDEPGPAREGALHNPNGLWVTKSGNVFILDMDNAKIRKVTPEGEMSTFITLENIAVGRGLWVADDESEAFICNDRILLRWTPENGSKAFSAGFGELGMVLRDDSGRLLVGDRGKNQVFAVEPNGAKVPLVGTGAEGPLVEGRLATETPVPEPRAIWPFKGGLFVGLHDVCRVLFVDDAGVVHQFLTGSTKSHSGDGEDFDTPGRKIGEVRSVSVTPQGDLLIVESDLGYVRRVEKR